ncbi:MAG: restriction endonuclease subunit S [Muribaculaceae bacterium]|nr:restriction endonuclease subunit S [Muribaculaceae bacterium]
MHVWSARRVHEKDWRKSGVPFYRAREIGRLADFGHVDNDLFIDKSLYDEFSTSGIPNVGDLLVTAVGTLGKVFIVNSPSPIYFKDGSVLCFSNYFKLNPSYLKYAVESPMFVNQYIGESQGTTVATLTMVRVNEYLIPIPPLKEQDRIVSTLSNVLPIVRKYSISKQRLDCLYEDLRPLLRKSILQEAIQGRLVAQSETDEPASILLEKIRAEKERLVKEGKLKKSALTESVIFKGDDNKYFEKRGNDVVSIDDEIPFDIPITWEWGRFGSLIKMRMGKTPPRGDVNYWSNGTTPWISISDMSDYGIIENTKEQVSDYAVETAFGNKIVPAGTLIMSFKLTVGRTSILNIDAVHNEAIISIIPYIDNDYSLRDYLFYILPLIANLGDSKEAIKGKTLNSTSLFNLLIPLPPLAEQRRIVNAIISAWQVL